MELAFKPLQDGFTGTWPAALQIENAEYTATLFYAGADPSGDAGEYAADLAAGRLDRRRLTISCKPKDRRRETSLGIVQGRVVLALPPIMPNPAIEEARRLAADLTAAIASAEALEDFIAARFGPLIPVT